MSKALPRGNAWCRLGTGARLALATAFGYRSENHLIGGFQVKSPAREEQRGGA
jgi:hypothetical protein